ncbi:NADPH:quinone oxidoreductase family protein [Brevundimonas sp.]|uniref:NADPH:quinone oxidoreductase family protein n=1 Tax=Brevundimonas sp. TaxID=1871086 RepID=UPI001A19C753|nr:NADPH:quinone oxidoreductase family protein [Brevundimonas sp.]MBJ7483318.1 NADPH:quinone oxidoreductase family protein [Brevundimonas sp.]
MRALQSVTPGGPETLLVHEVDEPVPAAGQVAVEVHACGVNFPDVLVIEDRYQLRPTRPFSPGSELSGVVRAVGPGVVAPVVGQRVSASLPFGAMAEVVVVSADRCTVIPDAMPFDEAAAFQVTYGTVYYALVGRAGIGAGETLLVLGAGGGIGLAAVELGKALGARVVAAASSQEKLDAALARGADSGVLYDRDLSDAARARAFTQALKDACGEDGADIILDPVGGAYAEPAFRSIAWEGRYLVVGFAAGIPSIPLNLVLLKNAQITGVFWGAWMARDPLAGAQDMRDLMALHAEGCIRPLVSERYPLERGGEAIARLASRGASGKIVVEIVSSENRTND